jgi:hypothetical protein
VARPYPAPSAEELLAAVRTRQQKLTSMRAEARADHMGEGGERVKLTINMLLAEGGKLRLEAESPVGGAVATLTADGQRFSLLDARNNRFLVGPARPCNIARLIRVQLEPEDAVQALTGSAPAGGTPAEVGWDSSSGGREMLTLATPDGGRETLWLDSRDRRWDVVRAEKKDAGGRLVWKLAHEDFEEAGGFRLPKRTTVEDPPHKADVQIRFRSREPNVQAPADAFKLEPKGLKAEEVGCS